MNILIGGTILLLVMLVFSIAFWAHRRPGAGSWADSEPVTAAVGLVLAVALFFSLGHLIAAGMDFGAELAALGAMRALMLGAAAVVATAVTTRLIARGRRYAARAALAVIPAGFALDPRDMQAANTDAAIGLSRVA